MSKNRKKPRKPTGSSGPTHMRFSTRSALAEFRKLPFPSTKEEIESLVVNGFLASATEYFSADPKGTHANPLDGWDFIIKADGAEHWLELMELAPLEHLGGSYGDAPATYYSYDFAKYAFDKLMRKSTRYSKPASRELWLLLYITAWQFTLSSTVIALLQYWTCTTSHVFDRIYLYMPILKLEGMVNLIYPTPLQYWHEQSFDPERYRDNVVHNLDPGGWKSGPG